MRCLSLFGGIGGFDIAGEVSGWQTVAFVEWEKFPTMVSKKHFPKAEFYGDIDKFEAKKYAGSIDVVFGGFPCQPFSVAGNQIGTEDPRYKWPSMLRVIREVGPRWVVAENVPGLLSWNDGMVLDTVLSDLEAEGYETLSPLVLPACATNAPHRRDRVWIVAYSKTKGRQAREWTSVDGSERYSERYQSQNRYSIRNRFESIGFQWPSANAEYNGSHGAENGQSHHKRNDRDQTGKNTIEQFKRCSGKTDASDPDSQRLGETRESINAENKQRTDSFCGELVNSNAINTRLQRIKWRRLFAKWNREKAFGSATELSKIQSWDNFPTQPPVRDGDDGIFAGLVRHLLRSGGGIYTEETAARDAWAIISKVRKEAIKAGGNAIVWKVAYNLFQTINHIENEIPNH